VRERELNSIHQSLCYIRTYIITKVIIKAGVYATQGRRGATTGYTPVWCAILQGLQNFRDITTVKLGDGSFTSFWLDLWLDDCTLAERFPALFSHSLRKNISVAEAISSGDPHSITCAIASPLSLPPPSFPFYSTR
jgi:hypothetical protein